MSMSVANEFGLWAPDEASGADVASSSIGNVSGVATSVTTAGKNLWYTHPSVAVAAVVITTAALVGSAAKPARASAKAKVGPAEAGIEGSI